MRTSPGHSVEATGSTPVSEGVVAEREPTSAVPAQLSTLSSSRPPVREPEPGPKRPPVVPETVPRRSSRVHFGKPSVPEADFSEWCPNRGEWIVVCNARSRFSELKLNFNVLARTRARASFGIFVEIRGVSAGIIIWADLLQNLKRVL